MQEIKRVGYPGDEVYSHIGAGQGIYIIFYIEYCHGAKPHLVLYNDLYGAILDRDFKSTCSQLFRNLDNVAHTNAQKDFIQDFFMKRFNYNVESKLIDAARTFIKVNRQRAYHVYDPGECIRGKSFFRLYRQYEGGGNKGFVEVTNVDEGARFSLEYRWYYHWLKHKETGVVTTYLDDSNTRLPDELIEDAKEEDYEIRGPVVIYEMKFHNDNDNYDYYRFKVGGAGANRIAYCSNTFPAEIDVDEEYPNVKMYIEYKYPSLYSKVKVDDSINYSTEQYFSDDGDRCWPFAIRLNVADILHAVKPMKKSDRGQIKCRIGFFYPDSGKFSRPSEWFKISLRHHNSPLGATFIK